MHKLLQLYDIHFTWPKILIGRSDLPFCCPSNLFEGSVLLFSCPANCYIGVVCVLMLKTLLRRSLCVWRSRYALQIYKLASSFVFWQLTDLYWAWAYPYWFYSSYWLKVWFVSLSIFRYKHIFDGHLHAKEESIERVGL